MAYDESLNWIIFFSRVSFVGVFAWRLSALGGHLFYYANSSRSGLFYVVDGRICYVCSGLLGYSPPRHNRSTTLHLYPRGIFTNLVLLDWPVSWENLLRIS
jgi:hypothetical protein